MSSIFGVVHLDQSQIDRATLAESAATLRHRGDVVFEKLVSPHAFVSLRACERSGDRAGSFGDGETFCVFEGRPGEALTIPVVQALAASDQEVAVASLSPTSVSLFRDVIGMRTLYFRWDQRTLIFATEIRAILAHPQVSRTIDWVGLAGHAAGESSVADTPDTCFSDIYSVPPGHRVDFRLGEPAHFSSYWDFAVDAQDIGFEEACTRFRDLFLKAVERRVRSTPSAVSVSGGLDSSAIYCAARFLGYSVQGLSYVSESQDRDERMYLKEIEKHYGDRITQIPMCEIQHLSHDINQQVDIVESPLVDYLWRTTNSLHAAAERAGTAQILSGHWGDQVLFATGYLVDLLKQCRFSTMSQHLGEYDKWLVPGFARREARSLPLEIFKSLLPSQAVVVLANWRKRQMRRHDGALRWPTSRPADRPRSQCKTKFGSWQTRRLYMMVRSKHFSHCLEWCNKAGESNGVRLSFPLIERDLLQFLMTLPGDLQNHNGIPRAILRTALRGIVPDSILERNWKADFSDVVNRSARHDLTQLLPKLIATELPTDLVPDRSLWREELEGHATDLNGEDCTAAWRLYDLYALSELYNPSSTKTEDQHEKRKVQEGHLYSAQVDQNRSS